MAGDVSPLDRPHSPRATRPPSPARLTVIVPTLGREEALERLLGALEAQTFPRAHWSLVVSFDGSRPGEATARRLEAAGAGIVLSDTRRGPGAARNRGAAAAGGDILAFTEDDCLPAPDWLVSAVARLERDPRLDVLEGATLLPDGRPVRRRHGDALTWLPTNLFVRRSFFERIGGYSEEFFDGRRDVYFREDSDFGFSAREAGARAAFDPAPRVTHPPEHRGWLDPIRWARRYEMDPLLAARHPKAFRDEIEIVRLGPFRFRRPFVRACAAYAASVGGAVGAAVIGEGGVASFFLLLAALSLAAVWSKWSFHPARLPLLPFVPFVLLLSLARGRHRARAARRPRSPTGARRTPRRAGSGTDRRPK